MRKSWALGLLLLAACQSKPLEQMSYSEVKALAADIQQRCYAQGVKPRSREFDACTQQEITREQATRASNYQRRMAVAAAMGNVGAQMQANAAQQQAIAAANRPRTCNTTPGMNGTFQTTCY